MAQTHGNVWKQTLSLIAATTFKQFEDAVVDPVVTRVERDAYWDRYMRAHDALVAVRAKLIERMTREDQWVPPAIQGKSRMRQRARTDLCGGRSAMIVPTASVAVTVPRRWLIFRKPHFEEVTFAAAWLQPLRDWKPLESSYPGEPRQFWPHSLEVIPRDAC